MIKSNKIRTVGGMILLTALLLAGCSGEEKGGQFSAIKETVDTVAAKVADAAATPTYRPVNPWQSRYQMPDIAVSSVSLHYIHKPVRRPTRPARNCWPLQYKCQSPRLPPP